MGKTAQIKVKKYFSWDHMEKMLFQFIKFIK